MSASPGGPALGSPTRTPWPPAAPAVAAAAEQGKGVVQGSPRVGPPNPSSPETATRVKPQKKRNPAAELPRPPEDAGEPTQQKKVTFATSSCTACSTRSGLNWVRNAYAVSCRECGIEVRNGALFVQCSMCAVVRCPECWSPEVHGAPHSIIQSRWHQ